jgi:phage terminase large subunit GpA-like protein
VNLDQGRAYFPLSVQKQKSGHELQARAEHWEPMTVPRGVRFLVATVDVQAGTKPRFVVQVTGFGVGLERWIVDRYALRSSERVDPSNPPALLPLDPSSYVEDWRRRIARINTLA